MACGGERGYTFRLCLGAVFRKLREELLLVFIICGVMIGFIVGASVNGPINEISDPELKATAILLVGFPGELFMNMLKMLVLPLIVASLITALSTLDSKATGKIGRRTVLFYLGTMLIAVVIGVVLVMTIRPGERSRPERTGDEVSLKPRRNLDSFLDLLRNCFPSNIVEATFTQKRTKYLTISPKYNEYNTTNLTGSELGPKTSLVTYSNGTQNITMVRELLYKGSDTVPSGVEVSGRFTNVLGLVAFSIIFGIVLGRTGEQGEPVKVFFRSLNEVIMGMVTIVMWFSPLGIGSMIAVKLAEMAHIGKAFEMLGLLMGTAISGLFIHGTIVLPLVYFVVTRKNPFIYIKGVSKALATVYGTDSSAATLPTTIKCVEENNHVDTRISRFVLPLGATVNMDGTALYQGVCTIWIAQINGVPLGPGQVITTILTAMAAAIGTAAIPSGGLVTLLIVLQAVNLPTSDVGLLWAIDWFVDRFRGLVNVLGDAIGAGVVEHLSRDDLALADLKAMEEGEGLEVNDLDEKKNPLNPNRIVIESTI